MNSSYEIGRIKCIIGLTLTENWNASNVLGAQIELTDSIVKGLKLDLNGSILPAAGFVKVFCLPRGDYLQNCILVGRRMLRLVWNISKPAYLLVEASICSQRMDLFSTLMPSLGNFSSLSFTLFESLLLSSSYLN